MLTFRSLILYHVIILTFYGSTCLKAQIYFDANFEHGSLDSVYFDTLSGAWTTSPDIFVHYRAVGVLNDTTLFRIWDKDGYRLRNSHRMVYSYENDSVWYFFDNGSKTGSVDYYYYSNNSEFTADTVYIAYWFPWTYTQQNRFMQRIQGNPYLRADSAWAISAQGRNIYGFQITDPTYTDCIKQQVFWTGLQHPSEFKQSYITNGFVKYLLKSQDGIADSLRKYFVFNFLPMINPDGVYNGFVTNAAGQDMNRSWSPDTIAGGNFEIDQLKKSIWVASNGEVDYSIDIHSNPGHQGLYYYFGVLSAPSPDSSNAIKLVDQIHVYDSLDNNGDILVDDVIAFDTYGGLAFTAGNWFNQTMRSVSFTFEPGSVPPVTIDRLEMLGSSMARGFYDLRINRRLSLTLNNDSSFQIFAAVAGGLPPYSFLWNNDSTLPNNDTLIATASGQYSVVVSDKRGCSVSDTIYVTTSSEEELDKASFQIFPNPTSNTIYLKTNLPSPNSIQSIPCRMFYYLTSIQILHKQV